MSAAALRPRQPGCCPGLQYIRDPSLAFPWLSTLSDEMSVGPRIGAILEPAPALPIRTLDV